MRNPRYLGEKEHRTKVDLFGVDLVLCFMLLTSTTKAEERFRTGKRQGKRVGRDGSL